MEDRVKSYLTIAFSVVVVCLIAYNLYTGATVQEIGIPGVFTISFRPKSEPQHKASTPGTGQDVVEKSEKQKSQGQSDHNAAKSSGLYPRNLDISGSATAGDYQFRVLSAHLDEHGQDETTHVKTLLLSLRIRETYNSTFSGTGYFMPDGFRLIIDDTVVAPKDCPIENIAKDTTKDGTVTFILPENAQMVRLRVGYYDGQKNDIPLSVFPK